MLPVTVSGMLRSLVDSLLCVNIQLFFVLKVQALAWSIYFVSTEPEAHLCSLPLESPPALLHHTSLRPRTATSSSHLQSQLSSTHLPTSQLLYLVLDIRSAFEMDLTVGIFTMQ